MDNVYPEDVITVEMQANPVEVSGAMDFDNPAYSFDFGKYVDNELGVFRLPEGKEISVEFEAGEDRWIKLAEKSPREWRVLAGWRPNDPTADGRKQEGKIIICNTGFCIVICYSSHHCDQLCRPICNGDQVIDPDIAELLLIRPDLYFVA